MKGRMVEKDDLNLKNKHCKNINLFLDHFKKLISFTSPFKGITKTFHIGPPLCYEEVAWISFFQIF